MRKVKLWKLLSMVVAASVLMSCIIVSFPVVADTMEERVRQAATAYVLNNKNNSTKDGLLQAVQAVAPSATLADGDFAIYYAKPGAVDTDTTSGYQLKIPGNDGGVAAWFDVDGQKINVAVAFSREQETIEVNTVAIAGGTNGDKLIYDSNNNVIGCVDGVDKIVIPEDYPGNMGVVDFTTYPAMNNIKVVVVKTRTPAIKDAFHGNPDGDDSTPPVWASLRAMDYLGGNVYYWMGIKEFTTCLNVTSCPVLKYVALPLGMDNGEYWTNSCFADLPELETVNIPFSNYYLWGCFRNTGVREYVLGGFNGIHWVVATPEDPDNCFSRGKTVSVIKSDTPITFQRAAAWAIAAVNEQVTAGKADADAISAAKEALASRAWNSDAKTYFDNLDIEFSGGWESHPTMDIRLLRISSGTDEITGQLAKSRPVDEELEQLQREIAEAGIPYVKANKNESTKEGLLAAVQAVIPEATITSDDDFAIRYAQPGATDTDTTSGYHLNIPGNDGAVSAIFTVGGKKAAFVCTWDRDVEVIKVNNVAVAGVDNDKLFYDDSGRVIGCIEGVDKIVIPSDYKDSNGNPVSMGVPNFAQYPGLNKVKVVMIKNKGRIGANTFVGTYGQAGETLNWTSLMALDICGGEVHFWSHADGSTKNWLGNEEKNNFSALPALKYLYLPHVLDGEWLNNSNFQTLPALETANVPLNCIYKWGCFKDTGIREFILSGTFEGWNSYFEAMPGAYDDQFCWGGKTVSVITKSTPITFARAAAWMAAAVNEQVGKGLTGNNAVNAAKKALSVAAWSEEAKNYLNALMVEFVDDWSDDNVIDNNKVVIMSADQSVKFSIYRLKTISGLDIGFQLTPGFSPEILEYEVTVPNEVTSLNISVQLKAGAQLGEITGNQNFSDETVNTVNIPIITVTGDTVTYVLKVTRAQAYTEQQVTEMVYDALDDMDVTSNTTADDLEAFINSRIAITGYSVKAQDFFVNKPIGGAKDNYGIIVPGYSGAMAAVVALKKGDNSTILPLQKKIDPPMKEYYFTEDEVSKPEDFLLSEDGKVLEYYIGNAKKVVIPDGVETLDAGWFDGDVESVVAIIVPDSVTESLGGALFYHMPALEAVYLGDGLTELPALSFRDDFMLQYVRLPETLTTIGNDCFRGTASLQEIYIPASVETLNGNAFYQSGVRRITLPGTLSELWQGAFAYPNCGPSDVEWLENDLVKKGGKWEEVYNNLFNMMQSYRTINPVITVLNPSISVDSSFASNNTQMPGTTIIVKAPAAANGENWNSNHEYVIYNFDLNMSLAEVAARVRSAVDNLALTNKTTADDVMNAIKAYYYSLDVKDIGWVEDYVVNDGKATGKIAVSHEGVTFEMSIDAPVKTIKEKEDNPGGGPSNGDNGGNNGDNGNNNGDNGNGGGGPSTGVNSYVNMAASAMIMTALALAVLKRRRAVRK